MKIESKKLRRELDSVKGDYKDLYAEKALHYSLTDYRGRLFYHFSLEEGKALRWIVGETEYIKSSSLHQREELPGEDFLEDTLRRLRDRGLEGEISINYTQRSSIILTPGSLRKKKEEIYLLQAKEGGVVHRKIYSSRPSSVFLDGFVNSFQEKKRTRKAAKKLPQEGEMFFLFTEGAASAFAHEIFWHPLEVDLVLRGQSPLSPSMLGRKIFPSSLSLVSSSNTPDDEGKVLGKKVLIEKGRLVGFASSVYYSLLSRLPLLPHGRRQNYRFPPLVRPKKVIVKKGRLSQIEVLQKIKKGILVREIDRAWVDFRKGEANFRVSLGYWVEKGRALFPLTPLWLSVNIPLDERAFWSSSDLNKEERFFCIKGGQRVVFSSITPDFLVKGFSRNV